MTKQDIKNLSYDELADYLKGLGEKSYRATQIFEWVYQKGAADFDEMTNLSAALRGKLKEGFEFSSQKVINNNNAEDKTKKFLFELKDGETIETVLIPTPTRATVCVSTQAGCKFGCRFCASGIGGWKRNLTSGEILEQLLYAQNQAKDIPLSHIVFMGVGEPLDNYDNLIKAIRIINGDKGLNIAARRITISTCGLIPKIKALSQEGLQVELAISLHGYSTDSRNVLMPVNKKYPFADLVQACREYTELTKRQITFEYILIRNVTCSDEAARSLGKALKGMLCKMNLIPYNKVEEFDHEPPTPQEATRFRRKLAQYGIHATIRAPRGRDVSAACGQLRHSTAKTNK